MPTASASSDVKRAIGRKFGPQPVWAWALEGFAGLYWWRHRGTAAGVAPSAAGGSGGLGSAFDTGQAATGAGGGGAATTPPLSDSVPVSWDPGQEPAPPEPGYRLPLDPWGVTTPDPGPPTTPGGGPPPNGGRLTTPTEIAKKIGLTTKKVGGVTLVGPDAKTPHRAPVTPTRTTPAGARPKSSAVSLRPQTKTPVARSSPESPRSPARSQQEHVPAPAPAPRRPSAQTKVETTQTPALVKKKLPVVAGVRPQTAPHPAASAPVTHETRNASTPGAVAVRGPQPARTVQSVPPPSAPVPPQREPVRRVTVPAPSVLVPIGKAGGRTLET